jgi:hypothetical protein
MPDRVCARGHVYKHKRKHKHVDVDKQLAVHMQMQMQMHVHVHVQVQARECIQLQPPHSIRTLTGRNTLAEGSRSQSRYRAAMNTAHGHVLGTRPCARYARRIRVCVYARTHHGCTTVAGMHVNTPTMYTRLFACTHVHVCARYMETRAVYHPGHASA